MAKRKRFIVNVKEVHIQPYMILAPSKAQAIAIAERRNPDEVISLEDLFCYSHTLDSKTWTIEEQK